MSERPAGPDHTAVSTVSSSHTERMQAGHTDLPDVLATRVPRLLKHRDDLSGQGSVIESRRDAGDGDDESLLCGCFG